MIDASSNDDYARLLATLTAISDGVAVHECSPGVIAEAVLARWRLVPVDIGATRPPSETYNGHRDWPQPVEGWNYVTEETLDTGLVTRVYTTRSGCEA